MAAAQAGDRDALAGLLEAHQDRLYSLCRRVTGNEADAADACQEALIAIVRGLDRFDGRSSFGTWAYRIATNACLDELRRRRRRPDPVSPETVPEGSGPGAPTPTGDPYSAVEARLVVDSALRDLPADYRTAVVLRDLCGLPYDEIAEVLEIPIGTVRSRIARGRSALLPSLSPGGNPSHTPQRPSEQA